MSGIGVHHYPQVPDEIIRLIQGAPEGSFDSALLAGEYPGSDPALHNEWNQNYPYNRTL
jgi:hypothetical protein